MTENPAQLTPDVIDRVQLANIANIFRKVKAGKPLTKYEQELLEQHKKNTPAPVHTDARTQSDEPAIADENAPRAGTKFSPIRWTIERAASEFGVNPRTVSSRLKGLGIEPGQDGKFSTQQICTAVFSEYEQERTRLTKAQADKAELDLSVSRKEVVPVDIAFQTVSNLLFAVRRVIETSELSNDQKDDIYRELQSLKPEDIISEAKFEEGEE